MGRPTIYSSKLADEICDIIASSNRGLAFICKNEKFPCRSTVHKWITENKEFLDKYTRAREDQADFLAEEILEIADHSDKDTVIIYNKSGKAIPVEDKEWTNRSRLRVEARKWIASKLKAKKYGDKIDLTTDGEKVTSFNIGFKKPEEEG